MSETNKVDAMAKGKMADDLQLEAKWTSWDYVHYDRESAMDIVEIFIRAGWAPVTKSEGSANG